MPHLCQWVEQTENKETLTFNDMLDQIDLTYSNILSTTEYTFFFFFFFNLFLAVLGLHFCVRAFSSCGERGPLFIAVRGPLTVAASPVAEHRLQTRRLSSCGSRPSRSAACGIFLDQGTNPCPLHWQADS